MNDEYILMHKNIRCGLIAIDRDSGQMADCAIRDTEHAPFLGNATRDNMKSWWNYRAVPGSRKEMEEVIRRAGCETNPEYLAKNLALSITDTYWICPMDLNLSWEDVSLHRKKDSTNDAVVFHNATSYDPNASLGGQMNKYWDVSGDFPVLKKIASAHYGQQSVNEKFATMVHERQGRDIPYVKYSANESEDNSLIACCDAFTSEAVEFIPAYEILRSCKRRKSRSDFDSYLDACEKNGIDRELMQEYMDYMILTDFAISNTDRHLQNFGILRDADTMELVGPAPIFDSGNSMFYNVSREKPYTRAELLDREISSFHSREEKMLKHVSNKNAMDVDKLPSAEEVRAFYADHGIPEKKTDFIAGSYSNKVELLRDFQKGKSITLYFETRRANKR